MLFQSLRALCLAPGGPGSIWNHLGAPVRSTGVSGRFACGFRTDLHFADVCTQSHAKPKCMRPQIRRDGNHPDAVIKDFRALLDIAQDALHWVAIYSGMGKLIKHRSRNKTYISDEQLHTMELCIYHGTQGHVEGSDGEPISQMCRYTGSQIWRGGARRNDWVWVKQCLGRCYGTLNGRLPWQLQ
jgi:hypothetical protein